MHYNCYVNLLSLVYSVCVVSAHNMVKYATVYACAVTAQTMVLT